jgi:molybdopterin/thiamine biosynthesis adenylyltransferase/TusA-related sulfurtransferase
MSTALIIGIGGLGCPAALSLAEGGVERLILVDPDTVALSNLQRQVLYGVSDVGLCKVDVASRELTTRFPQLAVVTEGTRFTAENAARLLDGVDIVIDGTDDPAARFLINDCAFAKGIPAVLGGILRFEGLVMAVSGSHGPCFRCLFEEPPGPDEVMSCGSAGVLGALAGAVGHLQAVRALGILGGNEAAHTGFVTTLDGLRGTIRDIPMPEATGCVVCGGIEARLDITPFMCPMTYVRTRMAMEQIEPGQLLDVVMRRGEPSANVPRSLREEGHQILSDGPMGTDYYRVVVRRSHL